MDCGSSALAVTHVVSLATPDYVDVRVPPPSPQQAQRRAEMSRRGDRLSLR